MVIERDILTAVPGLLDDLLGSPVILEDGSTVSGFGIDLVLTSDQHRFVVAAKARVSSATLEQGANAALRAAKALGNGTIPLVAVPFVGDRSRTLLAELGVGWIDLCGNALIKAAGLLVMISGNENRFKSRGPRENPFSPKSSRVARALLQTPLGTPVLQSELTNRTGLGRGFISRILKQLERDGFITRESDHSIGLVRWERLLQDWRASYEFERHKIIRAQVFARNGLEAVSKLREVVGDRRYAFTGLSGALLLSGHASFRLATVFVDALPSNSVLKDAGIVADDRGANVWIVVPNDEAVFDGAADIQGYSCCSPLQVYLDLKAHPERAAEAAAEILASIKKEKKHARR